jgi:hypothetical protein
MVKPIVISRNLLVVAGLALLFCCDAVFWHTIPLGYEGMLAYGGFAFWFGAALTLIALGFLVFSFFRHGRARSSLITLGCGLLLFIGFAVVAILSIPVC